MSLMFKLLFGKLFDNVKLVSNCIDATFARTECILHLLPNNADSRIGRAHV